MELACTGDFFPHTGQAPANPANPANGANGASTP